VRVCVTKTGESLDIEAEWEGGERWWAHLKFPWVEEKKGGWGTRGGICFSPVN